MMGNWFLVKVSYEKMMENGVQKKVTEQYLVDAMSFAEAEARGIEELRPFITGEFSVSAVGLARINEVFYNDKGDRYYKPKLYFITLDEKTGMEKRYPVTMMAQASNIKEAISVVEDGMKGTMADYEIVSVTETPIMDVFEYKAKD